MTETVKEIMQEAKIEDLEREIAEAKSIQTPLLMMDPVMQKSGSFIKDKPYDTQPVLQRISILTEEHQVLMERINLTDTSMITDREINAYNALSVAFEEALKISKDLL